MINNIDELTTLLGKDVLITPGDELRHHLPKITKPIIGRLIAIYNLRQNIREVSICFGWKEKQSFTEGMRDIGMAALKVDNWEAYHNIIWIVMEWAELTMLKLDSPYTCLGCNKEVVHTDITDKLCSFCTVLKQLENI